MSHTIETVENCRIVWGELPIQNMVAMLEEAPEHFIMHIGIQNKLGASMVLGAPESLDLLVKSPYLSRIIEQRVDAKLAGHSVSAQARTWMIEGDVGKSSGYLFSCVTGVSIETSGYPRDPADFGRCRKLCEKVPEVDQGKYVMSRKSHEWASLINSWDDLCVLMDTESPDWREGKGSAPRTFALMQQLYSFESSSSPGTR